MVKREFHINHQSLKKCLAITQTNINIDIKHVVDIDKDIVNLIQNTEQNIDIDAEASAEVHYNFKK